MPTDGETDRDLMKLTVPCRNFADSPKIVNKYFENMAHFTFSGMKKKQIKFALLEKLNVNYRSADKSLARPGRKQATATEDFDVHMSY
jgi:hypothetical protein